MLKSGKKVEAITGLVNPHVSRGRGSLCMALLWLQRFVKAACVLGTADRLASFGTRTASSPTPSNMVSCLRFLRRRHPDLGLF